MAQLKTNRVPPEIVYDAGLYVVVRARYVYQVSPVDAEGQLSGVSATRALTGEGLRQAKALADEFTSTTQGRP